MQAELEKIAIEATKVLTKDVVKDAVEKSQTLKNTTTNTVEKLQALQDALAKAQTVQALQDAVTKAQAAQTARALALRELQNTATRVLYIAAQKANSSLAAAPDPERVDKVLKDAIEKSRALRNAVKDAAKESPALAEAIINAVKKAQAKERDMERAAQNAV